MANEITLSISGTLANSNLRDNWTQDANRITQTTAGAESGYEAVTTAEANWTHPTTGGLLFIKNTSTVNSVTFGPNVSGNMAAFGTLAPAESAVIRIASSAVTRALSSASTVNVQWKWWRI